MGQRQTMEALRNIAARQGTLQCYYCKVPTAATIEHIAPRSQGGQSWAGNVVLACPYCNQRKSSRSVEEFIESGDWKTSSPEGLPDNAGQMLKDYFGWDRASGLVSTGSVHSKLELKNKQVTLLVRPSKQREWTRFRLGSADSPAVAGAAYDFLTRHFTPKKPKQRPPKHVFKR
jgi:hypothetical protein